MVPCCCPRFALRIRISVNRTWRAHHTHAPTPFVLQLQPEQGLPTNNPRRLLLRPSPSAQATPGATPIPKPSPTWPLPTSRPLLLLPHRRMMRPRLSLRRSSLRLQALLRTACHRLVAPAAPLTLPPSTNMAIQPIDRCRLCPPLPPLRSSRITCSHLTSPVLHHL